MVDLTAKVTMRELGTQQMIAEVATQLVTREVADLVSPGGSRPMKRSYQYQPTPPERSGLDASEQSRFTSRMLLSEPYAMLSLLMREATKRNILPVVEIRLGAKRIRLKQAWLAVCARAKQHAQSVEPGLA